MAVTSSILEYAGRKIDLVAWHGLERSGEVLLDPVLVEEGQSGNVIAGVQKLVQRVLIFWLTAKGSVPYNEDFGTEFMTELLTGQIRTNLDAEQSFRAAIADTRRALQSDETDDIPDDEQFGAVELLAVAVTGDQLIYRIRITSLAGDSRVVLFPLPTTLTGEG